MNLFAKNPNLFFLGGWRAGEGARVSELFLTKNPSWSKRIFFNMNPNLKKKKKWGGGGGG